MHRNTARYLPLTCICCHLAEALSYKYKYYYTQTENKQLCFRQQEKLFSETCLGQASNQFHFGKKKLFLDLCPWRLPKSLHTQSMAFLSLLLACQLFFASKKWHFSERFTQWAIDDAILMHSLVLVNTISGTRNYQAQKYKIGRTAL